MIGLGIAAAAGVLLMFFLRETGLQVFNYALIKDINAPKITKVLVQSLLEMGNWNVFF